MRYKHIVFDLDRTLIDTERAILPSLRDTLEELTGRHYEEQALTFCAGHHRGGCVEAAWYC